MTKAQESIILANISGFIKSIDDKFTTMATKNEETKAGTYKRFDSLQAEVSNLSESIAVIKATMVSTTTCQEKHDACIVKLAKIPDSAPAPTPTPAKSFLQQFSPSQIWSYGGVLIGMIAVLMGAAKAIDILLIGFKILK